MTITSINVANNHLNINYTTNDKVFLLYSEKCPYCRKFLPVWDKSINLYSNKFDFELIDCDKTPDVSNKYEFRGLPTVIRQQSDNEIDRTEGYQEFSSFDSFLNKNMDIIVNEEDNYSLLLLYTESCPFCVKFLPILEKFEKLYNIPIKRTSCTSHGDICKKHTISGVPTLIIYNNDNIIDTGSGFMDFDKLISFVKSSIIDLDTYKSDTADDTDETVLVKKQNIIAYFNPACHFCKKFEPVWNKSKEQYSIYFNFENVNCSTNKQRCNSIQGVPSIDILDTDNNIIDKQVGYTDYDNFIQKIEKYITKYTLTIIINQYCDFSKKMIDVFNEFKKNYPNILTYEVLDNTFENNFKLDFFIDSYPIIYLHNTKEVIKKEVGYKTYIDFKNWILFE
jgi:thioredoxin-like negative regulator of GroEL